MALQVLTTQSSKFNVLALVSMYCKPRRVSFLALAFIVSLVAQPARATTIIGSSTPIGLPSQTSGSGVFYYSDISDVNTLQFIRSVNSDLAELNLPGATILGKGQTFWDAVTGSTVNAHFHGFVSDQTTPANPNSNLRAGGFVREEVYFETLNGNPGTLEFILSVDARTTLFGADSWTTLGAAMDNTWANLVDPMNNPYQTYSIQTLNSPGAGMQFVIRTNDFQSDYLVGSGMYLPFSLGIWGTAHNASLDWLHTIELTAVNAYDQNGNKLSSDQFKVNFVSDQTPNSVPEPGSLLLLGMGLAALKKRKLS